MRLRQSDFGNGISDFGFSKQCLGERRTSVRRWAQASRDCKFICGDKSNFGSDDCCAVQHVVACRIAWLGVAGCILVAAGARGHGPHGGGAGAVTPRRTLAEEGAGIDRQLARLPAAQGAFDELQRFAAPLPATGQLGKVAGRRKIAGRLSLGPLSLGTVQTHTFTSFPKLECGGVEAAEQDELVGLFALMARAEATSLATARSDGFGPHGKYISELGFRISDFKKTNVLASGAALAPRWVRT